MRPRNARGRFGFVLALLATACASDPGAGESPIPARSGQMLLVLSESFDASSGTLRRFERDAADGAWRPVGEATPITLGRNGMGIGAGLHEIDPGAMPVKREGDGKSPAGVFRLSAAFGYATAAEIGDLAIPYTQVTPGLECVDDPGSAHYNQIVSRDAVATVDWQSSEQMLMDGPWYEQGIVVDHNADPARAGAGSCIFLHNWDAPDDTTAGCTAMAPVALSEILRWIDGGREPVLVQLTEGLYERFATSWGLPEL